MTDTKRDLPFGMYPEEYREIEETNSIAVIDDKEKKDLKKELEEYKKFERIIIQHIAYYKRKITVNEGVKITDEEDEFLSEWVLPF